MNKRDFLKVIGSATLLLELPGRLWANSSYRRCRPSDAAWPSQPAWKQLDDAVGGNLVPVNFSPSILKTDPESAAARRLLEDLKNPYSIGDQPGLTQTLGWIDAWATQPSIYAVAAKSTEHIAAAVKFARENNLRLVIKGGGHSYQGTSNAPDSLLIWTRHMNEITTHTAFVPQGCEQTLKPQPAVTVGAGTIGMQAYTAVTTEGGKYVQGGGCTTVGLTGLVQSGGFGSFSKHYGLAAGGLLEAEVVTADGIIRVANGCTNSDLFWALKGGGGGTFGVVSKMTLRLHELPGFFGAVNFTIKADSDDAYKRLIREFLRFYSEHLFNDHWGEQAHVTPGNTLRIRMVSCGLDTGHANEVWQPFLDWLASSPSEYSHQERLIIGSVPARRFWDLQWWKEHWPELAFPNPGANPLIGLFDYALAHVMPQPVFQVDQRPGAGPDNVWWAGDGQQVGQFLWGYESLWLPASLLESDSRDRLANALFASSRYHRLALHFNKGLAGAPPEAIAAARDTAMNPAVLTAFALAISAAGQGPAYPGIPGHEPSVAAGHKAAEQVHQCMAQLRKLVPDGGSYVSESNYFESGWQQSYWGSNYPRLAEIKAKYDPEGLFFVQNGVGSEQWSADGFTKP
ncbi:MAG: FAD-binding oxidoreductase [Verrucomicrobia bacterium]|nr:FAD-binding oxidoreductase [Verrucomicrobiota bacterium]